MYLPDINFWLALTFKSHVHHSKARSWYSSISKQEYCYFSRVTQLGFLRLANNKKVFPDAAVTQDIAWSLYDDLMSNVQIQYAVEPPLMDTVWRSLAVPTFSPNLWNDAYLASFAMTTGLTLVTFDQGFKQFAGLNCVILT